MKRLLICLFVFFLSLMNTSAQQYWVYSVTGEVKIEGETIKPRQLVYGTQKILIPANSQISLFDNAHEYLYHLTSKGTFKIEELVNSQKPSVKQLSRNYLTFIKDNLFGKKEVGVPAMGERGDKEDLLFLSTLIQYLNLDASRESMGKSIYEHYQKLPNDYLLKCEFYDKNNDNKLISFSEDARVDCFPVITNFSNENLYVSIVTISPEGNIDAYFRGDASQYIVPANSTISFKKYYRHWEENRDEKLFLFAAEYPINISVLTTNIEDQLPYLSTQNMKLGVALIE